MNKEFIPYEQALELKNLGFCERCMGSFWEGLFYYETTHSHPSTMPNSIESCLAQLYQQAFRWFREKHWLHCHVEYIHNSEIYEWYLSHKRGACTTYEEAELACLRKLIQIVKNK